MSTVVNCKAVLDLINQLGWPNQNDLLASIFNAPIPASVIVAYLSALAATPTGLNDQTVAGVTAAQGTQITTFLVKHGLVGT